MRIRKTIGRDMPDGRYLEVEAELREAEDPRELVGGLSQAFSVTALEYSSREAKRLGRDAIAAGAIHEEVLEVAPELEPLVRVHLSSPDGTPMHAEANGRYHYEAGRFEEAREALHLKPGFQIAEDIPAEDWHEFIENGCRPIWTRQAAEAREVLEELTDGAGVESVLEEPWGVVAHVEETGLEPDDSRRFTVRLERDGHTEAFPWHAGALAEYPTAAIVLNGIAREVALLEECHELADEVVAEVGGTLEEAQAFVTATIRHREALERLLGAEALELLTSAY